MSFQPSSLFNVDAGRVAPSSPGEAMTHRPYQDDAVEKIIDYAIKNPRGRLLLVSPPGSGKTRMAAIAARIMAHGNRLPAIVVVHRRELVGQHREHLLRCGIPEEDVGVIMGGDKRANPSALIQIVSIDTINRRDKPAASLLIMDEAHRDASKMRRKLRALYPNAFHLGLTATPCRLSKKETLRDDFDEMLVVTTPSELILGGWYAAPKVYSLRKKLLPDLTSVRTRHGDFEQIGLEESVNKKALIGRIVKQWKRLAKGVRTVVFATSVEHSKRIVDRFKVEGVPVAHIDDETSSRKRAEILGSLAKGDLHVVSCVNILSEGWDCPECKCVILARPTKSLNMHIQQTGRPLRPWMSTVPIILDHAGNMLRHGLPHAEREWTLDGEVSLGNGEAPVKTCEKCEAVVHAACHACPECGFEFPLVERVPPETDHDLITFDLTSGEERIELKRLRKLAIEKKLPPEWVVKVFVMKFDREPRMEDLIDLGDGEEEFWPPEPDPDFYGRRAPYGYTRSSSGYLVPVEAEQKVLDVIRHLSKMKWRPIDIASELEKRGLKGRGGKLFTYGLLYSLSCWRPSYRCIGKRSNGARCSAMVHRDEYDMGYCIRHRHSWRNPNKSLEMLLDAPTDSLTDKTKVKLATVEAGTMKSVDPTVPAEMRSEIVKVIADEQKGVIKSIAKEQKEFGKKEKKRRAEAKRRAMQGWSDSALYRDIPYAPYGYSMDDEHILSPIGSEQKNIRKIEKLYAEHRSIVKVALVMAKLGLSNRYGRSFNPSNLHKIIQFKPGYRCKNYLEKYEHRCWGEAEKPGKLCSLCKENKKKREPKKSFPGLPANAKIKKSTAERGSESGGAIARTQRLKRMLETFAKDRSILEEDYAFFVKGVT